MNRIDKKAARPHDQRLSATGRAIYDYCHDCRSLTLAERWAQEKEWAHGDVHYAGLSMRWFIRDRYSFYPHPTRRHYDQRDAYSHLALVSR